MWASQNDYIITLDVQESCMMKFQNNNLEPNNCWQLLTFLNDVYDKEPKKDRAHFEYCSCHSNILRQL